MEFDTRAADRSARPATSVVADPQADIVRGAFQAFLEQFREEGSSDDGEPVYVAQMRHMQTHWERVHSTTLYVHFPHLAAFSRELQQAIENHYYRYEPHLRAAVQAVGRKIDPDWATPTDRPHLDFWLSFSKTSHTYRLRELKTAQVGRLVSVCGTVTRTSEVRPELLFASFQCLDCHAKVDNVEQHFKYTQPMKCKNALCQNTTRWQLDPEGSRFADWQKVRVQENATEIPSGAMPRTLEIILRNDGVEKAKAGDRCEFIGTLIVVPDVNALKLPGVVQSFRDTKTKDAAEGEGISGLKALGVRELTYKLSFLASAVQLASGSKLSMINIRDENDGEGAMQLTVEEEAEILKMARHPKLYAKLVQSIAPSIYGHEEVKKGILLMLFGGVHKVTKEGMNLRGDINVCVVGDPSVAKSQFLKYVVGIAPRSVYTAGKASSAAGLTATVVKDSESGEFNIEAGALMLADNGICCIDEFDKMDPADQVAIHEAMEQQTISIAKAGIHASLNARTSILAAANPIGGRYDKTKSLRANLTITPAIMSRFDLMYVVLDKNDPELDDSVARYIVSLHQHRAQAINPPYSTEELQRYIRYARDKSPTLSEASRARLSDEYIKLRLSDQGRGKTAWRITVRQLESMIRLSEALARLHLDSEVRVPYVEEASRLLRQSIVNVHMEEVEVNLGREVPEGEEDVLLPALREDPRPSASIAPKGSLQSLDTLQTPALTAEVGGSVGAKAAPAGPTAAAAKKPPKRTTKVSKDFFDKLANTLISYMRQQAQADPANAAIRQGDLVDWYMQAVSGELEGEGEVQQRREIVRAVIARLVNKDKSLLVLKSKSAGSSKDDRLLAISPDLQLQDEQIFAL